MTTMADDRDALLREVDEELRRDQMEKLWQRYNGLILGCAGLIVLGVGGYQIVESRRIAAAQAAGDTFAAAVQLSTDKKQDEAQKAFETIAASGPAGYAALARLNLAGAQLKAGKTADALASYEALAKNGAADDLLKSFAQLQAAALRMGEADFTEIQNRLTPLAADGSAYKTSARELLGLAAYKAGNLGEARKYLEPLLIDPNATRQIQDRIKIVMGKIAEAEVTKAPASAAQATTDKKPDAGTAATPTATAPDAKHQTEKPAGETPEKK